MTDKAKDPPNNLALWDTLGKTDPAHTKQFKRAGGFSGTALKPMWVWKRLTEQFGAFGRGWGCDKPEFALVPAGDELLVYCTVGGWHGSRENTVWGVGGDKVIAMTKNGARADDEAYKKAFTDALMNAFKFVGAGADIHMGLFDDNKYVQAMEAEFAPVAERVSDEEKFRLEELATEVGADIPKFLKYVGVNDLSEILASDFERAVSVLNSKRKAATSE